MEPIIAPPPPQWAWLPEDEALLRLCGFFGAVWFDCWRFCQFELILFIDYLMLSLNSYLMVNLSTAELPLHHLLLASGPYLWLHVGSHLSPLVRVPIERLHAHEQVPRVWHVKRAGRTWKERGSSGITERQRASRDEQVSVFSLQQRHAEVSQQEGRRALTGDALTSQLIIIIIIIISNTELKRAQLDEQRPQLLSFPGRGPTSFSLKDKTVEGLLESFGDPIF